MDNLLSKSVSFLQRAFLLPLRPLADSGTIMSKLNYHNLMKIDTPLPIHTVCLSTRPTPGLTPHSERKGPATRCDAVHPRWDVPMHLRCSKIACDALRCIFQHVGNFAPDFGISVYLYIWSNPFLHNGGNLMSFHLICVSKVYVISF